MASYNGSRFIREQLRSILEQSLPVDEIIIVDDASSDCTTEIIRDFADPRIILIQNKINLGVVASFEKSLVHATGDLIFLCDQDDVWRVDKVETFYRFFMIHPKVTAAVSDANVIDQNGDQIRHSWLGPSGFRSGLIPNLIKNRYTGCAMAFRRSALEYCLPIPPRVPMHDAWIGMANQLFGDVGYIADPLFSYRRHGNNVVTGDHAPLKQMAAWRFHLSFELYRRFLKAILLP